MVAIAIVVVLVGIVVWGLGTSGNMGKVRATRLTMENMRSMLTAMKGRRQPAAMYVRGSSVNMTPAPPDPGHDFWHMAVKAPAGAMALDQNRFDSDAVLNTQILLRMLRSVPENRDAVNKFPTDSLLKVPTNAQTGRLVVKSDSTANPPTTVADPPMPIDTWGNPIIFVPRGGLEGVRLKANSTADNRITSAGVDNTSYGSNVLPPTPAGAQPFFASAGPDGDFTTGDDNVYSFEN